MMTESDLNLLEAYLDDALSPSEVQRVDARLSEEPELAAALDSLRGQRATRVAAFASFAPTELEADHLAATVLSSIRRGEMRRRVYRNVKIVAGLAACLTVGFAVGWIERGRGITAHHAPAPLPVPATTPGHGRPDSHMVVHTPKPAEPGQFQVALLDENGNVIAVQRFSKLEDARKFADDLGQFEVRRHQVQDGQAMLVSDQF